MPAMGRNREGMPAGADRLDVRLWPGIGSWEGRRKREHTLSFHARAFLARREFPRTDGPVVRPSVRLPLERKPDGRTKRDQGGRGGSASSPAHPPIPVGGGMGMRPKRCGRGAATVGTRVVPGDRCSPARPGPAKAWARVSHPCVPIVAPSVRFPPDERTPRPGITTGCPAKWTHTRTHEKFSPTESRITQGTTGGHRGLQPLLEKQVSVPHHDH